MWKGTREGRPPQPDVTIKLPQFCHSVHSKVTSLKQLPFTHLHSSDWSICDDPCCSPHTHCQIAFFIPACKTPQLYFPTDFLFLSCRPSPIPSNLCSFLSSIAVSAYVLHLSVCSFGSGRESPNFCNQGF